MASAIKRPMSTIPPPRSVQLGLDFLDAGEAGVEPVVAIALPGQATGSGARVFGDEVVAGLAEEQADGGGIVRRRRLQITDIGG